MNATTIPGRIPGRYYDERGNELVLRAATFNALPASRRPLVYDHCGRRVIRVREDASSAPACAEASRSSAANPLVVALNVMVGIVRLFVRVLLLLARLV